MVMWARRGVHPRILPFSEWPWLFPVFVYRRAPWVEARVKQMPHLGRRLAGARLVAPVQAMGPLAYRVSAPREGGVLLVGDAAGFYDPFTGEGIFTALRSAELAVDVAVHAVRTHDVSPRALARYHRERAAVFNGVLGF